MDNIYSKVLSMGTDEMLGRVDAAVTFLNYHIAGGCFLNDDKIMRNMLKGAEKGDVYGRIRSLIGYITGEEFNSESQKLVYEMLTGEKMEVWGGEEIKKA